MRAHARRSLIRTARRLGFAWMRGFTCSAARFGNTGVSWGDTPVADSTLLFVYGSLKRGRRHHAELAGARFIGAVRTAPEYRLLDLGEYPALTAGGRSIEGELYEVTGALLEELDRFEGDGYDRALVRLADGGVALAYFATAELTRRAPEVAGDAW